MSAGLAGMLVDEPEVVDSKQSGECVEDVMIKIVFVVIGTAGVSCRVCLMLFSLGLLCIAIYNYRSFIFLLNLLIRLGIIFMRFLHSCFFMGLSL
jgi:hypothetical protein